MYEKNQNPVVKAVEKDNADKILAAESAERRKQEIFSNASKKYVNKLWEDAYLPYYNATIPTTVVSSIISVAIGVTGCAFIVSNILGTTIGTPVGIAIAIIMEVVMIYLFKMGFEALFAERKISAGVQLCFGAVVAVLSMLSSYQSTQHNEHFKQWIAKEAGTATIANNETIDAYNEQINNKKKILSNIEIDRKEHAEKNKTQTAKWKRADEEIQVNKDIAELEAKRDNASKEIIEQLNKEKEANAALSLNWWVWLLVVIPTLFSISCMFFNEYYEYRVVQLGRVRGRKTQEQTVLIENDKVNISAQTTTSDDPVSDQMLKSLIIKYMGKEQEQKGKGNAATPPNKGNIMGFKSQKNTSGEAENNIATRSNKESSVATQDDTGVDVDTHSYTNGDIDTRSYTELSGAIIGYVKEYEKYGDELLLGAWRELNTSIKTYEAKPDGVLKAKGLDTLGVWRKKREAINAVLNSRGKHIEMGNNGGLPAYKIVNNEAQ